MKRRIEVNDERTTYRGITITDEKAKAQSRTVARPTIATREMDWAEALGSSLSSLKVSPSSLDALSIRDTIFLRLRSCLVANGQVIIVRSLFLCPYRSGNLSTHGKIARYHLHVTLRRCTVEYQADRFVRTDERGAARSSSE